MIMLLRFIVLIAFTLIGQYLGVRYFSGGLLNQFPWLAALFGALAGFVVILLDLYFKHLSVRNILSVLIGSALGLWIHSLLMQVAYNFAGVPQDQLAQFGIISAAIFAYLGAITVLRGQDEFAVMIPFVKFTAKGAAEDIVLLDTSVIIDGRVADICETAFLSGKLYLPRFVLKELQLIADSSDPLKRNRGRRGLDILNRMKKNPQIEIKIHETDYPELNAVDAKLVKLGLEIGGKVLTNDFNLNKVAELQGVKVLNINELANALKPIVIPGEMMQVKVLKEGKEQDQGVAYLDDGTMVVVDGGRRRIGQTLSVTITSVLQTQAGRMIFAKPTDESR
ncbi:MAG: TRAM domain-containing protein [Candidatus Omnitrophica bacterium]|nr:TRAM domain-containing protein [Candidatus Omnitrophota bacterium]